MRFVDCFPRKAPLDHLLRFVSANSNPHLSVPSYPQRCIPCAIHSKVSSGAKRSQVGSEAKSQAQPSRRICGICGSFAGSPNPHPSKRPPTLSSPHKPQNQQSKSLIPKTERRSTPPPPLKLKQEGPGLIVPGLHRLSFLNQYFTSKSPHHQNFTIQVRT